MNTETHMISLLLVSMTLILTVSVSAQGHIDHIRNQPYMKDTRKIDCANTEDLATMRICANLAFQKSDSLLTVYYETIKSAGNDAIDSVQVSWRAFRDAHCNMIYDQYSGGTGHFKAIVYLQCLNDLTTKRIEELKELAEQ